MGRARVTAFGETLQLAFSPERDAPADAPHLPAKPTERGAEALIVDLEDSEPDLRKVKLGPRVNAAMRALSARDAA